MLWNGVRTLNQLLQKFKFTPQGAGSFHQRWAHWALWYTRTGQFSGSVYAKKNGSSHSQVHSMYYVYVYLHFLRFFLPSVGPVNKSHTSHTSYLGLWFDQPPEHPLNKQPTKNGVRTTIFCCNVNWKTLASSHLRNLIRTVRKDPYIGL